MRIISLSSTISLLRLQHYRWLDETPTGRIITRSTQDIRAIDGPVPQMFSWLLDLACGMVTKLGAIVLFTPLFLVPGVGVAIFGLYLGNLYLKAQLSVKRETRYVPRGPMLTVAHVAAVMLALPCWRISAQLFMELVCT